MAAVSQAIFLFVVYIQLMMKDLMYFWGDQSCWGNDSIVFAERWSVYWGYQIKHNWETFKSFPGNIFDRSFSRVHWCGISPRLGGLYKKEEEEEEEL
jgi:hypothetical protein